MSHLKLVHSVKTPEAESDPKPMGIADETWAGFLRLREQLDKLKAACTHPIEVTWQIVWANQLETAIEAFLADHPELKQKRDSGGES